MGPSAWIGPLPGYRIGDVGLYFLPIFLIKRKIFYSHSPLGIFPLRIYSALSCVKTKRKWTWKRKFSLMFAIYSLILFACSLIFFAFAPSFVWCEWALTWLSALALASRSVSFGFQDIAVMVFLCSDMMECSRNSLNSLSYWNTRQTITARGQWYSSNRRGPEMSLEERSGHWSPIHGLWTLSSTSWSREAVRLPAWWIAL